MWLVEQLIEVNIQGQWDVLYMILGIFYVSPYNRRIGVTVLHS